MTDPYAHVPPPRPGGPDPDAPNPFAGIGAIGPKRSTPEEEKNTRTVVIVVPLTLPVIDVGGTMRNTDPVRYEGADDFDTTDGELIIWRAKHGCAIWAPGTWARVEITEEPAEPAGPGTFEVYEDTAGKYRYRLKAANGEVIATGQAYSTRKGAHGGVAAVQRAAKGAPIVDLDGDDQ